MNASRNRHPAIDGESVADDVTCPRTAEPQHNGCDFFWLSRSAHRNLLRNLAVRILISTDDIAGDLRVDQTGIHGVDPNTLLHVFDAAVRVNPTTPCLEAM